MWDASHQDYYRYRVNAERQTEYQWHIQQAHQAQSVTIMLKNFIGRKSTPIPGRHNGHQIILLTKLTQVQLLIPAQDHHFKPNLVDSIQPEFGTPTLH